MSWGIVAVVGSTAVNAYGAHKAGKQQAAASREAEATQRAAQDRAEKLMTPYTKAGQPAQQELMAMLGLNGKQSTYQNPMLAQIQQQTLQNITNRNAATGRATGEGMAGAIAQSLIQPAYQMQQNRIGQLQNLTSMSAGAAANAAGLNSQIASNIAGSQINTGNALAAGTAGMYGSIADGIGQMGGMMGSKNPAQKSPQVPSYKTTIPVQGITKLRNPLAIDPMRNENFRTFNFPGVTKYGR